MTTRPEPQRTKGPGLGCFSRRAFLLAGGTATVIVTASCAGFRFPKDAALQVVEYPRKRIARLDEIVKHQPVMFGYPGEGPHFTSFLVDLDERAAGGVGPQESIVAFNATCTHMGGPLAGTYNAKHRVTGPCPLHLTTFDLKRHGMIVSGHATETLPQMRLEVVGGDVYATGVMALIFGLQSNRPS